MRRADRLLYITRYEYGRQRGWWVRFQRMLKGGGRRTWQKFFSDARYGDKRKALEVAMAWRDEQLSKVPKSRRPVRVAVGYGYVKRRSWNGRDVFSGWIRLDGGRNRATMRSVSVWGVRGAKREAEKWLEEQRADLRARGKLVEG